MGDETVDLIGVEAGGTGQGVGQNHAAPLSYGRPGVLHGSMSYLMQDKEGQVLEAASLAPGLDYPGVGPEHAYLKETGRATYVSVNDQEALEGFDLLCNTEGIIPALEPCHAVYYASKLAAQLSPDKIILVCLSGPGRQRHPDSGRD